MEKVLPLRTAPSQMTASHRSPCLHHQVSTLRCLGGKCSTSAVLPAPFFRAGRLRQRLIKLPGAALGAVALQQGV